MKSTSGYGGKTPGTLIRERRLELGFTQEELAYDGLISVMQLGRLERDESNPTLETILKLEEVLDMDLLSAYVIICEKRIAERKLPHYRIMEFKKRVSEKRLPEEYLRKTLFQVLKNYNWK